MHTGVIQRSFAVAMALVVALLAFTTGPGPARAQAPPAADPVGTWEGALEVGVMKLRLVVHIRRDGDGYRATMDSPDQGAKDIPISGVAYEDPQVTLDASSIRGRFVGERDAAFGELRGTWSQGGQRFPLVLRRVDAPTALRRPQSPKPPFPYRSEDVTFRHLSGGFELAGTLTMPEGPGPFPAAILITGSGAQDRDETIFEHRPFLVIADRLTRLGMAVLRVDDRGVGGSGHDGDPKDDTTMDFASDVRSSLAFLRSRPEVDSGRSGLIGHSEGGLIATIVAAADTSIAFVVLLAAPGVRGDELLYVQSAKLAQAGGADAATLAWNRRMQEEIFRIIRSEPDMAKGRDAARAYLRAEYEKLGEAEQQQIGTIEAFAEQHSGIVEIPWFRTFITYDPRPALRQVRCPVLALTGEKDLQVAPEQNLPEIDRAVRAGGNDEVTIRTMPGLNHLLQTAKTGLVTEYGEIEETIAPAALVAITGWLRPQGFVR